MSNPKKDYHEQADQSINQYYDEVTGLKIKEDDETPTSPKKDISSPRRSLYRSVFGNF